jgi:chromosome segregation ATPase
MCSQNLDEVEAVKDKLLKAGIATETRCHPVAEELGVNGVELWVQDERDFFNAARLLERMQDRAAGETPERSVGVDKPTAQRYSAPHRGENSVQAGHESEPCREELRQASSLLEKGIKEMFARESQLAEECASLRSQVQELSQALAQGKAAFGREIEGRSAAEKNLTAQISGLVNTLERERHAWQQQLKSRDDSLKNVQKDFSSMLRRLQAQQAAAGALKEEVLALEMQREEHETLLSSARAEALAEREARIAAEEQAEKANQAQEFMKKQLVEQMERQQQVQTYVAGLSSLLCKTAAKAVPGADKP